MSLMRQNISMRYAGRLFAAALAAVVLVWTGCDGSEDPVDDDSDRFVGAWDAASLKAGNLDVLGELGLVATFGSNGSVQIVVSDAGGELANVSGQYDVDTGAGRITLSGQGFDEDLKMGYDFVSDVELKLTFSGADLQKLGIDLGEFGGLVSGLSLTATLEKRNGT